MQLRSCNLLGSSEHTSLTPITSLYMCNNYDVAFIDDNALKCANLACYDYKLCLIVCTSFIPQAMSRELIFSRVIFHFESDNIDTDVNFVTVVPYSMLYTMCMCYKPAPLNFQTSSES